MDFATLLVRSRGKVWRGKVWRVKTPMYGALFAFSLLWPADGSGRVGMAQTKYYVGPTPNYLPALALDNRKASNLHSFDLLKESHSLTAFQGLSAYFTNSHEPCSLLVIPSSSPYFYTHGGCVRERDR